MNQYEQTDRHLSKVRRYIDQLVRERDEARAEAESCGDMTDMAHAHAEEWQRRALAAEAELERLRAELDSARSLFRAVDAEVDRLEKDSLRAAPQLPDDERSVAYKDGWDAGNRYGQEQGPPLPNVGPVTRDGRGFWVDGVHFGDWVGKFDRARQEAARYFAVAAFLDAEAAAPAPDTSLVTFGARHKGTGMVLLQHADMAGAWWGNRIHETADMHFATAGDPSEPDALRAAHAALAEVREALNTAEADGVDVNDGVICGIRGSFPDYPQDQPILRARRYLAREVQALVDQGLRGDDLNARLPYEVRDHRTPVEAAAPDNDDEVQAFLGAIHDVGYGDAEPADAIRLIEALDAHRARSAEGGVTA